MREEEKVYIQDAFRYLVACTGSCVAKWHAMTGYTCGEPHWSVEINGKFFAQNRLDTDKYHFVCKTESGTVEVSFARKEF